MLPNVSFIGHLAGILVGMMIVSGTLSCLLPSSDCYLYLQSLSSLSSLTHLPNYIPCNDSSFATASPREREGEGEDEEERERLNKNQQSSVAAIKNEEQKERSGEKQRGSEASTTCVIQ
mmetsp:Transcript_13901/g.13992  ORF Transcript_13901/g.13992 Transcript_13901/m.13992 type:complete len:119 (+) Transcript_13901:156-512(+)